MVKMSRQSGLYDSSFSAARGIIEKSGLLRLLSRAAWPLTTCDVPFRAIQLPVYDLIKSAWLEHKNEKAREEYLIKRDKRRKEREVELAAKKKKTRLGRAIAKLKTKAKQSRKLDKEEAADLLMESFRVDEKCSAAGQHDRGYTC